MFGTTFRRRCQTTINIDDMFFQSARKFAITFCHKPVNIYNTNMVDRFVLRHIAIRKLDLDAPIVRRVISEKLHPDCLYKCLMTGADFKKLYPNTRAVKLINKSGQHYGMMYDKPGTYSDILPLVANGSGEPGGLSFMLENDIDYEQSYANRGRYHASGDRRLALVEIFPDSLVYFDALRPHLFKTDEFALTWV